MPPEGRPPNCGVMGGFPAGQLPCWSLIGRIGEQGTTFYVGNGIKIRAPHTGQLFLGVNDDRLDDNSGSWIASATVRSNLNPETPPESRQPIIVAASIQGGTAISLPPGKFYLYGMATGGAAPSSSFAVGQASQAVNASGQLAAALAYQTNNQNSFTTDTAYHAIGGVSIAGSWDSFYAFYGSNSEAGASSASVNFTVPSPSLVVVIGLAASQQDIRLEGIPGLQVDAPSSGSSPTGYMIIGHVYLGPGVYTAIEHSTALAAGQAPEHMADLIGAFVFVAVD
ncbi:MAG: hypothetical protein ACRD50_11860 [Candidatus Acidiferrales bacterium]